MADEFDSGDPFEDGKEPKSAPAARTGTPSVKLGEEEFTRRFLSQFIDPAFESITAELDKVAAAAWDGYSHSRKSPRTHQAGPGFANPEYELADDWRAAKLAIDAAQDWLKFMGLEPAGRAAELDRYIGYWQPYATSHAALDADLEMQGEVRNAAQTLAEAVLAQRAGKWSGAGQDLHRPRRK